MGEGKHTKKSVLSSSLGVIWYMWTWKLLFKQKKWVDWEALWIFLNVNLVLMMNWVVKVERWLGGYLEREVWFF